MKVEITYDSFNAEFSQEEFEDMAKSMQRKLAQNNYDVPMKVCLEIVSQQFGFTYKQILDQFEEIEFQRNKYILSRQWVKEFMNLNFVGWRIERSKIEDEEGQFITDISDCEVFGESKGMQFDISDVHEIIWKNLVGVMYLEVSTNPINKMNFKDKNDLEKYLLKNSNINSPLIRTLLDNIHKNMASLPKDIRIHLLDNIAYDYMPEKIDSKILYMMRN